MKEEKKKEDAIEPQKINVHINMEQILLCSNS